MNNKVILDASALIALLTKETGHELVQEHLPRAVMSSVNIAEVAKYLIERKSLAIHAVEAMLDRLIPEVINFDTRQAYDSAILSMKTKEYGLSLGDRACITLGCATGYPIYTADKMWSKLDLPCQINQIR